MKLHDALAAGIAHLSQNRLRTGLSILGILIGIASVLCMMAIGDGAKAIIANDIETLGGVSQVQFLAWILISVSFSIVIGIVFGVYPAIRASRLSPIDALRTET